MARLHRAPVRKGKTVCTVIMISLISLFAPLSPADQKRDFDHPLIRDIGS